MKGKFPRGNYSQNESAVLNKIKDYLFSCYSVLGFDATAKVRIHDNHKRGGNVSRVDPLCSNSYPHGWCLIKLVCVTTILA